MSKGQKNTERKRYSDSEIRNLYMEVNWRCPKCNLDLAPTGSKGSSDDIYRLGELAHIYPLHPTKKHEILKEEERLTHDVNDINNIIVLCETCHSRYDKKVTVESYRDMVALKKKLKRKTLTAKIRSTECIEDEIKNVLQALSNLKSSPDDKIDISYVHIKLSRKLKESTSLILKESIQHNIALYFNYIRNQLLCLNKSGEDKFEIIRSQISIAYSRFTKLEETQEEVYYDMWSWLMEQTHYSQKACEIVISFFIQNCEVFKEIDTTK